MATSKFAMLARSLSTSSGVNQLVKPPVQIFGIEGRYAAALYSAATKKKTLEQVEKELVKFQGFMKTDLKLREFIMDPSIKRSLKVKGLTAVAGKAALCPESTNFLLTLAENGRLKKINNVINAFKTIMAAHRGEVTCEVITAKDLDAAQKQKLEAVLKTFVKGNQTIQLTTKTDPTIIGGMVVSIADRYVDMSVASKIKKYTEILSTTV